MVLTALALALALGLATTAAVVTVVTVDMAVTAAVATTAIQATRLHTLAATQAATQAAIQAAAAGQVLVIQAVVGLALAIQAQLVMVDMVVTVAEEVVGIQVQPVAILGSINQFMFPVTSYKFL